jgi:nicotinamide mononucleotide (NMN) deamidase PncC
MAEAARARLGADIGVGITGVADPEEVEGKPIGSAHIAIVDGKSKRVIRGSYPPLRPEVKRRAAYHALFELRRTLLASK